MALQLLYYITAIHQLTNAQNDAFVFGKPKQNQRSPFGLVYLMPSVLAVFPAALGVSLGTVRESRVLLALGAGAQVCDPLPVNVMPRRSRQQTLTGALIPVAFFKYRAATYKDSVFVSPLEGSVTLKRRDDLADAIFYPTNLTINTYNPAQQLIEGVLASKQFHWRGVWTWLILAQTRGRQSACDL